MHRLHSKTAWKRMVSELSGAFDYIGKVMNYTSLSSGR